MRLRRIQSWSLRSLMDVRASGGKGGWRGVWCLDRVA